MAEAIPLRATWSSMQKALGMPASVSVMTDCVRMTRERDGKMASNTWHEHVSVRMSSGKHTSYHTSPYPTSSTISSQEEPMSTDVISSNNPRGEPKTGYTVPLP